MDEASKPGSTPSAPPSVFPGQIATEPPPSVSLGMLSGQPMGAKPNPFDQATHPMLQGEATSAGLGGIGAANPFRWKQFWLGLILPILIVASVTMLAASVENNRWDTMYHEETLSLSPDENGHFAQPFEIQEGHAMEYCWFDMAAPGGQPELYCLVDGWGSANSISIMQEIEYVPTIHSIQFNLEEGNGTFSLSFNGSFGVSPYLYGSIYSESGNILTSLESNDLVRGNTSYLNATFAPQNESTTVYLIIDFGGISERLEIYNCGDSYSQGQTECPNEQENHALIVSSYEWRTGEKIGEYSPDNATVWFVPNGTFNETFRLSLETYDEASERQITFMEEAISASFCCMPLIYVGAIITAFVRGNKGLGWGLISSGAVSAFLMVALIAFVIAAFTGGF